MNETRNKIKEIISVVFNVELDSVLDDASPDNIDNWDSLGHLNLIIALEEEFNISIPDEEVGNLVSVRLIEIIINDNI